MNVVKLPPQRPMSAPVRTMLEAFGEELPEVPKALRDLLRLTDLYAGGFSIPERKRIAEIRDLLARMGAR